MAQLIAEHGVAAGEVSGLVGLWVDASAPSVWTGQEHARALSKIGAIGVRLSRWVSLHGFALNLDPDLALYRLIVPCGVTDYGVCSLSSLTGASPSPAELAPHAVATVCERLERPQKDFVSAVAIADSELSAWVIAQAKTLA
jgi:lipoyl(octanoyl) transferase